MPEDTIIRELLKVAQDLSHKVDRLETETKKDIELINNKIDLKNQNIIDKLQSMLDKFDSSLTSIQNNCQAHETGNNRLKDDVKQLYDLDRKQADQLQHLESRIEKMKNDTEDRFQLIEGRAGKLALKVLVSIISIIGVSILGWVMTLISGQVIK